MTFSLLEWRLNASRAPLVHGRFGRLRLFGARVIGERGL
jgi:hypothetical protein